MNYLFNWNRDIKEHFINLLNKTQKDDFFSVVSEEDESILNWNSINMYNEILDMLGINVDEAIHTFLHYNLDIYFEVFKDEVWNTICKKLAIWQLVNWNFSGIILELDEKGYYDLSYIWDNSIIEEWNEIFQEERLKQYIGNVKYNNIFILMKDILLYDSNIWTYTWVNQAYEELFSNKHIYIPIDNKLVYINSTLSESDIDIYN